MLAARSNGNVNASRTKSLGFEVCHRLGGATPILGVALDGLAMLNGTRTPLSLERTVPCTSRRFRTLPK
jgi:hypothetical protein